MIIAIATNDRKTIARRTGRAKEFAFCEVENGTLKNQRFVTNPHDHDHDHDHDDDHDHGEHSHADMVKLLKQADVFVVRMVGKHFKSDLEQGNITYVFTEKETIDAILADY